MSDTMSGGGTGGLSAGSFPGRENIDRSASGLQYQKYKQETTATGQALGVGIRTVVHPSALFSHPPMSGGQFGGGHAKSVANFTDTSPEET
jgi:hypothetical protein